MNKFYNFIPLFIIVLFFNVFARLSPLSTSSLNTSGKILFNPPPGVIKVVSQNSDENWLIDSANLITWSDNIDEDVELHLYQGGSFHSVISDSSLNINRSRYHE